MGEYLDSLEKYFFQRGRDTHQLVDMLCCCASGFSKRLLRVSGGNGRMSGDGSPLESWSSEKERERERKDTMFTQTDSLSKFYPT